jgi:protein TonB
MAFYLWGSFGLGQRYAINPFEIPREQYLELALELAGPPEAPPEAIAAPPDGESAVAMPETPGELAEGETPTEAQTESPSLEQGADLLQNGPQEPTAPPSQPDNTVNLEETAPEFKSYHTFVRSAVARHWILPPEARTNFQPGRFTAVMTLGSDGQVILIVVEESSGSPSLDFAAMEALRGAAPYPPFPQELSDSTQLEFRLHFDYRAIQRRIGSRGHREP